MNESNDGGFTFLHSWSDDLEPAARRVKIPTNPVISLDGVYLPEDDAPALMARRSGSQAAQTVAVTALSLAAAWLMLRAK